MSETTVGRHIGLDEIKYIFSPDETEYFLSLFQKKRYIAGALIIKEGDPVDVAILYHENDPLIHKKKKSFSEVEPLLNNQLIGMLHFFSGDISTYSIEATTRCFY